jgi:hypothetical protein
MHSDSAAADSGQLNTPEELKELNKGLGPV